MLNGIWLKERFLAGICLSDSSGKPIPDSIFTATLAASKMYFQRKYGLLFEPSRVISGPVPAERQPANPNNETIIKHHGLDYDPRGFEGNRWHIMHLPYGPIKQIDYVGVTYGSAGSEVVSFPSEWWRIGGKRRTLRLFPGAATPKFQQHMLTHQMLPFMANTIGSRRQVPNGWAIYYQAGYSDLQAEAPDLATAIGMKAMLSVLPQIAMLNDGTATTESVSVDGLSQSRSYAVSATSHRYSPLQSDYEKKLEAFEKGFSKHLQGVPFFSV